MKVQSRIWFAAVIFSMFLGFSGFRLAAQQASSSVPADSSSTAAHEQKQDDSEDNSQFRHAANVKAVANLLHVSTETAAEIFEAVNSGILIFVILFFIAKVLPKAIRGRSATIQTKLIEARRETETANERLSAVEAKLARIGEDIEAIRQQTDRDIVEDEKRIKQSLEDERQRIVKSAEQEIESVGSAAKRDLKRFAAELAIENAAKRIQLSAESDKTIVERFGTDLSQKFGKGGQN